MSGRRRLTNSVVRTILRSPLHRLLSRRLAIVTYVGRRSRETYTLPVMYARHADTYYVRVLRPRRKRRQQRWWPNFSTRQPARLLVGGKIHQVAGEALSVGHPGHARALGAYQIRFPRSRIGTTAPVLVAFANAPDGTPNPPGNRGPQRRLP